VSHEGSSSIGAYCSYPLGSLKSKLCIQGRDMLYERCKKLGIDCKQTQKVSRLPDFSMIPCSSTLSALWTIPVLWEDH